MPFCSDSIDCRKTALRQFHRRKTVFVSTRIRSVDSRKALESTENGVIPWVVSVTQPSTPPPAPQRNVFLVNLLPVGVAIIVILLLLSFFGHVAPSLLAIHWH